jgi:twinkle protein
VGLERNQQAEDETERSTSVLRMLKERLSGDSAGKTWRLLYDRETGRMREDDGVNFGGVEDEF